MYVPGSLAQRWSWHLDTLHCSFLLDQLTCHIWFTHGSWFISSVRVYDTHGHTSLFLHLRLGMTYVSFGFTHVPGSLDQWWSSTYLEHTPLRFPAKSGMFLSHLVSLAFLAHERSYGYVILGHTSLFFPLRSVLTYGILVSLTFPGSLARWWTWTWTHVNVLSS